MHVYGSLKIELDKVFVLCNCAADDQRYSFTISPNPLLHQTVILLTSLL